MPGPYEPATSPSFDLAAAPPAPVAPVLPAPAAAFTDAEDPDDGGGLPDLYDIARLARRLGVEHATIRVWLSRKVPWLPPPDGRLNGGAVWRASTLEGVEERRFRRRPGRKPRYASPPGELARTGSLPVVPTHLAPAASGGSLPVGTATGQLPLVASTATGQLPVVASHQPSMAAATGQIPVVPAPDRARGRHAAPPAEPLPPA
ncbi:hypothetical protein [Cellulomonas oligotrophica]|uniref:Uncharacterized protein n=1 Tax=Cellulomonas oligotrophica TaxID=931536 RepID=A0A7Y9FGV0_9CELL|nr:hypothetical protein [Cellulomonas oligotrophica]NYD87100.1 hypothetical protein [Cellulomonas oligotrophica]GIG32114.1 hypothetical protein Col01nite_12730 [Cellulomonas oligotrophica]